MEDDEIIELYLARNEDAIRQTSQKYGTRLKALSFGIVQDIQGAEECENDTYFEAWNRIPPNEPRDYFYAFLARIIRHVSIDFCRKKSRKKRDAHLLELTDELEQILPAPDDCALRLDELAFAEAVNGFLRTLDAEKRALFLRRYWYLDSVADLSKRFFVSEGKIKTTLFRIRKQFKKYLEKEGYIL